MFDFFILFFDLPRLICVLSLKKDLLCVGTPIIYRVGGFVCIFLLVSFKVECLYSTCTKTQVSDKKASFLRLSMLGKCEFTAVNDHFESRSNSLPRLFRGKNGV